LVKDTKFHTTIKWHELFIFGLQLKCSDFQTDIIQKSTALL